MDEKLLYSKEVNVPEAAFKSAFLFALRLDEERLIDICVLVKDPYFQFVNKDELIC